MNSAYVELDGLPGTMFKETPAGLWIRQGTDEYLARAWTLSSDVVEVISKAATYGFTCLIRHKSPSPASRGSGGVEYIGFSRTAAERWVFVLDQFSCPSKVRRRWAVTSGCIGGRIEHTSAQLAEESSVRILAPGEASLRGSDLCFDLVGNDDVEVVQACGRHLCPAGEFSQLGGFFLCQTDGLGNRELSVR